MSLTSPDQQEALRLNYLSHRGAIESARSPRLQRVTEKKEYGRQEQGNGEP
jgi:hypothetical protein